MFFWTEFYSQKHILQCGQLYIQTTVHCKICPQGSLSQNNLCRSFNILYHKNFLDITMSLTKWKKKLKHKSTFFIFTLFLAIFVSRERKESREECKQEIKRRVNSDQPWEQFLIFPEGTTSNRQALMSFKQGGFLPGQSVQPVLIKYHLPHDTVSIVCCQNIRGKN